MQNLERLKTVKIPEVISAIQQFKNSVKELELFEARKAIDKRTLFNGEMIRLGSTRLQTFAIYGTTCITCDKKANHFAIERHPTNQFYHLNLYGFKDNGEELLFTHDHILARSLGGPDTTNNTQTMCTDCNSLKSIGELKELKRRKSIKNTNSTETV